MIEVLLLVAKGQLKCEITLRDMIMLCSSKPFQSREPRGSSLESPSQEKSLK